MIAIKGVAMPKSCNDCQFKANDYVCGLLDCAFSCNHFKERNYNCPLTTTVEKEKILDFIEDNRPTDIQTDWEKGAAYICDEIEKNRKKELRRMIAVKRMTMPKHCLQCPIFDGEYGLCNIIGDEPKADPTEERPEDCPLITIKDDCEDAISRQAMLDYQQYLHGKMSNEENYELWKFIKALPSVTSKTEPYEDAVSRKAVLATAGDSCLDLNGYEDTEAFCDVIKELPPVTPAPKKGKWLNKDASGHHFYGRCSRCGQEFCIDAWYAQNMRYCPACGTEMENS